MPLIQVDGFEVRRVIGVGGMGVVFEARQLKEGLDRIVRSRLPPGMASDPVRPAVS